jgi:hypothetical protein
VDGSSIAVLASPSLLARSHLTWLLGINKDVMRKILILLIALASQSCSSVVRITEGSFRELSLFEGRVINYKEIAIDGPKTSTYRPPYIETIEAKNGKIYELHVEAGTLGDRPSLHVNKWYWFPSQHFHMPPTPPIYKIFD